MNTFNKLMDGLEVFRTDLAQNLIDLNKEKNKFFDLPSKEFSLRTVERMEIDGKIDMLNEVINKFDDFIKAIPKSRDEIRENIFLGVSLSKQK